MLLLAGCATQVQQIRLSQPITLATGSHFELTADANCSITTGYRRTLHQGTHWEQFGSIDAGDVYRSSEQTLTVEGTNVYEAYIVVRDSLLLGFYLPVERTYTPASKQVSLATRKY